MSLFDKDLIDKKVRVPDPIFDPILEWLHVMGPDGVVNSDVYEYNDQINRIWFDINGTQWAMERYM